MQLIINEHDNIMILNIYIYMLQNNDSKRYDYI